MMVAEAPNDDDHKRGGMPDMSGMGGTGIFVHGPRLRRDPGPRRRFIINGCVRSPAAHVMHRSRS